MGRLFQDRKTGKRVRAIGGLAADDNQVMVQGNDGPPYYASLTNLLPCDAQGNPDYDNPAASQAGLEDEPIPEPRVDLTETRLNVNTATAEVLAKTVPGIGYRVAKRVKELQLTLPNEVFTTLDQLKGASPHVKWEEVFRLNKMFVG